MAAWGSFSLSQEQDEPENETACALRCCSAHAVVAVGPQPMAIEASIACLIEVQVDVAGVEQGQGVQQIGKRPSQPIT